MIYKISILEEKQLEKPYRVVLNAYGESYQKEGTYAEIQSGTFENLAFNREYKLSILADIGFGYGTILSQRYRIDASKDIPPVEPGNIISFSNIKNINNGLVFSVNMSDNSDHNNDNFIK